MEKQPKKVWLNNSVANVAELVRFYFEKNPICGLRRYLLVESDRMIQIFDFCKKKGVSSSNRNKIGNAIFEINKNRSNA